MKYYITTVALLLLSCAKKEPAPPQTVIEKETVFVESTPEEDTSFFKNLREIQNEGHRSAEYSGSSQTIADISGKHALTLQWISWDKPGTVNFTKIGKNLYKVSGSQKKGREYLTIEGEISQVSVDELSFDGTIKHSTAINANGKECVKTGPKTFLATKNRKYWRMQDMANCDGVATDYIDIYFD